MKKTIFSIALSLLGLGVMAQGQPTQKSSVILITNFQVKKILLKHLK